MSHSTKPPAPPIPPEPASEFDDKPGGFGMVDLTHAVYANPHEDYQVDDMFLLADKVTLWIVEDRFDDGACGGSFARSSAPNLAYGFAEFTSEDLYYDKAMLIAGPSLPLPAPSTLPAPSSRQ